MAKVPKDIVAIRRKAAKQRTAAEKKKLKNYNKNNRRAPRMSLTEQMALMTAPATQEEIDAYIAEDMAAIEKEQQKIQQQRAMLQSQMSGARSSLGGLGRDTAAMIGALGPQLNAAYSTQAGQAGSMAQGVGGDFDIFADAQASQLGAELQRIGAPGEAISDVQTATGANGLGGVLTGLGTMPIGPMLKEGQGLAQSITSGYANIPKLITNKAVVDIISQIAQIDNEYKQALEEISAAIPELRSAAEAEIFEMKMKQANFLMGVLAFERSLANDKESIRQFEATQDRLLQDMLAEQQRWEYEQTHPTSGPGIFDGISPSMSKQLGIIVDNDGDPYMPEGKPVPYKTPKTKKGKGSGSGSGGASATGVSMLSDTLNSTWKDLREEYTKYYGKDSKGKRVEISKAAYEAGYYPGATKKLTISRSQMFNKLYQAAVAKFKAQGKWKRGLTDQLVRKKINTLLKNMGFPQVGPTR